VPQSVRETKGVPAYYLIVLWTRVGVNLLRVSLASESGRKYGGLRSEFKCWSAPKRKAIAPFGHAG